MVVVGAVVVVVVVPVVVVVVVVVVGCVVVVVVVRVVVVVVVGFVVVVVVVPVVVVRVVVPVVVPVVVVPVVLVLHGLVFVWLPGGPVWVWLGSPHPQPGFEPSLLTCAEPEPTVYAAAKIATIASATTPTNADCLIRAPRRKLPPFSLPAVAFQRGLMPRPPEDKPCQATHRHVVKKNANRTPSAALEASQTASRTRLLESTRPRTMNAGNTARRYRGRLASGANPAGVKIGSVPAHNA